MIENIQLVHPAVNTIKERFPYN